MPLEGPEVLPLVLLGLRVTPKEEIGASPADLVYGQSLTILGDFVEDVRLPRDTVAPTLAERLRTHMASLQAHAPMCHGTGKIFVHTDLQRCTHRRTTHFFDPAEDLITDDTPSASGQTEPAPGAAGDAQLQPGVIAPPCACPTTTTGAPVTPTAATSGLRHARQPPHLIQMAVLHCQRTMTLKPAITCPSRRTPSESGAHEPPSAVETRPPAASAFGR
ncbi:uncharacterized protein LOC124722393 [Schistocerca piceifrons]|uniref:uncharacterized protein LOC124722393 n=1 Tax=Schistocerca piceifrons TaxID=274613 RepID=UPI001F5ED36C|nr:uncharacterized protein LOC124722393 [Schistocerca piceifrons]